MLHNRPAGRLSYLVLLFVVMSPQLGLSLITPYFLPMANDLNVEISELQQTMVLYMVGYAMSMFGAGMLADRFDASKVQGFGLLVFSVATICASLSSNIWILGLSRFLQALGGTSATVLCRLILKRTFPRDRLIRYLADLSMVISLTPAFAPLLGGLLEPLLGWRSVLQVLSIYSFVLAALCFFILPAAAAQKPSFPGLCEVWVQIRSCCQSSEYRWYALVIACVWMGYFSVLSLTPDLFQNGLELSGTSFGLAMTAPACGYWLGGFLVRKTGGSPVLILSTTAISSASWAALIACSLPGQPNLVVYIVLLFLGCIMVGVLIPYAQDGQLTVIARFEGVSTGLFFLIQMMAGAIYMALLNSVCSGNALYSAVCMAVPVLCIGLLLFVRKSRA
ncbi:MFS transporter [Corynebacterium uberis]|nr:MFS transporter [Corynebacterium uberis]UDL77904.1 MFS transporter [Corynebacterium uberis]UDL80187.1 MFS transporter [Corynebacterium uberis]UDL82320.1 MFS transporter [Corynebacterium uberis]UDL84528.1 MFS transporter [Corynebacterium uberis]